MPRGCSSFAAGFGLGVLQPRVQPRAPVRSSPGGSGARDPCCVGHGRSGGSTADLSPGAILAVCSSVAPRTGRVVPTQRALHRLARSRVGRSRGRADSGLGASFTPARSGTSPRTLLSLRELADHAAPDHEHAVPPGARLVPAAPARFRPRHVPSRSSRLASPRLVCRGSPRRAAWLQLRHAAPAPRFPEHRLRSKMSFLGRVLGTRAPPATLPINCAAKTLQELTCALELYSCLFP